MKTLIKPQYITLFAIAVFAVSQTWQTPQLWSQEEKPRTLEPVSKTELNELKKEVQLAEVQVEIEKQRVLIGEAEKEILVSGRTHREQMLNSALIKLERTRQQVTQMKQQFQNGVGSRNDLNRVELMVASAEAEVTAAKAALAASEHELTVKNANVKILELERQAAEIERDYLEKKYQQMQISRDRIQRIKKPK